ncbi:acyl-CoA carboxylase subunit beta [Hoyosella altamirensis]|uniref:Acetyl-CoA carboxylase carboxyltransferase component n=1 Tax=Hoyosella altamirensis TaxID=616997 RepID=A0A839RP46_9ACTN|nr:acyl-CoA carboxylase subunit beta [Hoyosella altamirensis]MBB3037968.1 acetyl-CoA carboxylase carboxyltransferase component [Hoyosella altamirensis]
MSTTAAKLADLREKLEKAKEPGAPSAIEKRNAKGLPSPRERIDMLLDPGSFVEIGALVKAPGSADNPYGDGVVTGHGTVEGRPVVVFSHDLTVFGGSLGEMFGRKVCAALDFALKIGCPVVGINDSGGARVQEAVTSLAFYAEIGRRQIKLSGLVPQISVMLGKCAGGAVYGPAITDYVVAVDDQAYMFITGPEILKAVTGETISAEDLGGARKQAEYGTVNHVAQTEADAFAWVRTLLGYLPSNCNEEPPVVNAGMEPEITDSDRSLDSFIPDADNSAYDMHEILRRVFDDGEFHEISSEYARSIIVGFSRIDGRPVGVLANQPLHLSGALDIDSSEKASRFIRFCNAFEIPIVCVVDVPGFLPGLEQERNGIIRRGAKILNSYLEADVPKVTVVVRKAYGGGYAVMGSKNLGADLNFAWPTARIAVMGAEGAVALLKRRELAAAGDKAPELRRKFIDHYNEFISTPYIAAERGYIDAVIEPSATRLELRRALRALQDKAPERVPKKYSLHPG